MQITVEVVPAQWAVRLTATGHSGTVTWREDTGRTTRLVGVGPVLIDRAAALNRPLTYFATDDASTVVAAQVTVPATHPVLGSITAGTALPVVVVDWRPYQAAGQSVWHPVLGRRDPLVTVHPMEYPSARMRLWAQTPDDRARILQILAPGGPLLLRSTCPDRLDTMTILVTRWRDPFPSSDVRSGPCYIELELQRVTDIPGILPPPPDRTYGTVKAEHGTYLDVKRSYADYGALRDGVPA